MRREIGEVCVRTEEGHPIQNWRPEVDEVFSEERPET